MCVETVSKGKYHKVEYSTSTVNIHTHTHFNISHLHGKSSTLVHVVFAFLYMF